jgi:PAS domain S-box-containing protein
VERKPGARQAAGVAPAALPRKGAAITSVRESTARLSGPTLPESPAGLPGDIHGALEDCSVPSYVIDRFGIVRWLNQAAREMVGDVRGRQFTSVVAPEEVRRARESNMRKLLGTERSTDASVVLVDKNGERVLVEINSVPLKEGGRIVGVFGLVPRREQTAPPQPHPHLTPRQNQVLHLLSQGHSTTQIAEELHLSVDTVRNHVRRMFRALDVHSRVEALAVAHRDGILRSD